MSPFLAIADLINGGCAIVAIDPSKRDADGCTAIVQSLHPNRQEAQAQLETLSKPESTAAGKVADDA